MIARNKDMALLTLLSCLMIFMMRPGKCYAGAGDKTCLWVQKPIVIDGDNKEWPQPYPFRDELDTKMQYAFANDATTLYVTLKTSDEGTRIKLRKNGLTIVVDTARKKLNTTSFGFTVGKDIKPGALRSAVTGHDTVNAEDRRLEISFVQLQGTPGYDGSYKVAGNKPGIAVAAAINDYNELVWEIAIPLKCIYTGVSGHVNGEDHINVCIALFGLTNKDFGEFDIAMATERENAAAEASENIQSNAMPSHPKGIVGSVSDGPVAARSPNGGMGVGIGSNNDRRADPESDPNVIDASGEMEARVRAGNDSRVWKLIRLSKKPPGQRGK
jgi:hypothetical protein